MTDSKFIVIETRCTQLPCRFFERIRWATSTFFIFFAAEVLLSRNMIHFSTKILGHAQLAHWLLTLSQSSASCSYPPYW
ncbi:hypothetical protein GALMADRAFT_811708 [Galerina marginata CBS 339.88]|uniref:Uncharacterized protein n=1 Tax=Galerina marginata (strain CBS 339.88) TaxID=685588 RepID=A0A067SIY8_GALM3|nr:hypothetical protein GALMADRAFT_811708 [Galerina marginata CBS 339.88]